MRVIIDCMGGDKAPLEVVKGACAAAAEYKAGYTLVGDEAAIREIAEAEKLDISRFEIVDAPVTVTMEDDPMAVIRQKKHSSMAVALQLLAEGKGDAVVSTGNTGALFTGATLIVKKIKGVKRPAIASILPMTPPVLLLDSGANVVCTDEYLEQFAVMGSVYMQKSFGLESPRVGLLNNGAEECKGTPLQTETYKRLSALQGINFVGNVEGNGIVKDMCDVLVADGFTGNVLLKTVEGMGRLMLVTMKDLFYKDAISKMSGLVMKKRLDEIKHKYDASEYGGAPILGISRPVIKAHGASDAKAVKNAIRQAITYAKSGAIVAIAKEIKNFSPAPAPVADGASVTSENNVKAAEETAK